MTMSKSPINVNLATLNLLLQGNKNKLEIYFVFRSLIRKFAFKFEIHAPVAELADALDLGSSSSRSAGSIPVGRTSVPVCRTDNRKRKPHSFLFYISTYCNGLRIRSCSFLRYSLSVSAICG